MHADESLLAAHPKLHPGVFYSHTQDRVGFACMHVIVVYMGWTVLPWAHVPHPISSTIITTGHPPPLPRPPPRPPRPHRGRLHLYTGGRGPRCRGRLALPLGPVWVDLPAGRCEGWWFWLWWCLCGGCCRLMRGIVGPPHINITLCSFLKTTDVRYVLGLIKAQHPPVRFAKYTTLSI